MAERSPSQGVRLQVAGAQSSDVGKSTARLNRKALQTLGIREGEIMEIVGKRTTAAMALPPYPVDEGLDRLPRANASTGKTLLARAVANEAEARFFPIAGPEIMGRFHGESDLTALCREAAIEALRRNLPNSRLEEPEISVLRPALEAAWNGPDRQEQATPAPGLGSGR